MSSPRERAAIFTIERSHRLADRALGALGAEPVPRHHELRQRIGEFGDQRHPRRGRQILQHQHRFPDRGEMAVTLDDAVPGKRRQFGVRVFDQFERGRGRADLGDRGADRAPAN